MATVAEKLRACGEGQESLRKIGVITEGPIHNINDNIRMAFAPNEKLGYRIMLVIADEIDAEEREIRAEAYISGAVNGLPYMSYDELAGLGLLRLPKDADGEYVHVGDELCGYGYQSGVVYCKAIVNEVMILVGAKDEEYRHWLLWDASLVRHHAPTVEDVPCAFAAEYDASGDGTATIKEYAAKLQLREVR